MAITEIKIPYFIQDIDSPVWYVYTDSFTSSNFNYKYYFDLYIDNVLEKENEVIELNNKIKINLNEDLKNYINNDFDLETTGITNADCYIKYSVNLKTLFDSSTAWNFTDDAYQTGYLGFVSDTAHTFSSDDVVYIDRIAVSYNNNYNGPVRITSVPDQYNIITDKNFGISSIATPGDAFKLPTYSFTNIVNYQGYCRLSATTTNTMVAGDTIYIYSDGSSDKSVLGQKTVINKVGNDLIINLLFPSGYTGASGFCYQVNYQKTLYYSDTNNVLFNASLNENEYLNISTIISEYLPSLTTPCNFLNTENYYKKINSSGFDTIQFFNTNFSDISKIEYMVLEKNNNFYYLKNNLTEENYILKAGSGPQNLLNTTWTTATTSSLSFADGDIYKIYLVDGVSNTSSTYWTAYPYWVDPNFQTESMWNYTNSIFNNPGFTLRGATGESTLVFDPIYISAGTYKIQMSYTLNYANNSDYYLLLTTVDGLTVGYQYLQYKPVGTYVVSYEFTYNRTASLLGFKLIQQQGLQRNVKINYARLYIQKTINNTSLDGAYKCSKVYTYSIEDCSRYNNCKLYFKNKMGGFTYVNFDGKKVETNDINRKYYKTTLEYDYNKYSNQIHEYGRDENISYILNSDFLNEDENDEFTNLMKSNEFYLYYENEYFPVILLSKSNQILKKINNDKFQYTIQVQKSNNKNSTI